VYAAPASPGARRAALVFIFFTVLLDILAFGLIIPVLPHLLKQFAGGDIAQATLWHGMFATAFMVMQFFFSPIQGALSDHFGRRPIILLSNLGLGIDFLIMALAGTLPLLFLGRLLSGITAASFSTANAYVADVTPPEKRAVAFGKIGMAFGLGFTLSPVFGAFHRVHPDLRRRGAHRPAFLGRRDLLARLPAARHRAGRGLARHARRAGPHRAVATRAARTRGLTAPSRRRC
jgi:DHA1 family tetracycline resistance protein-like MFS transporter